jgi:predicted acyl esterase
MSNESAVMLPAFPYVEADEEGVFSKFEPSSRVLPEGFQARPSCRPLPVDIVYEKDVAVTLRDGVKIYVDVFRPTGSAMVPAIVAWSPYGKSEGSAPKTFELLESLGMDVSRMSGLAKFEGPDPAFWCANGYAVCNPDARGVFDSEGDSVMTGEQDGRDCHDLIEWLAGQEWCTGKIGMSGTSHLSISQWFTAAEQPPHLTAIAPCEGMSDIYRDLVMRGGMPDYAFPTSWATHWVGRRRREDLVADAKRYPLMNDLWRSKIARLGNITVPAYIVASYSNMIHTPGTFRAWREIASTEKWLRIHNTMEWPDYYDEANTQELRRFFDHYLKGEDNGWGDTPPVRYSVLDLKEHDRLDVPATQFPPEEVVYVNYYLDGASGTLTEHAPARPVVTSYAGDLPKDHVSFTVRFSDETEIVGFPKVCLWVEADGWDDLDLFVFLQKLDASGDRLEQFTIPNHGPDMKALTDHGAAILKYKGSNGRLRVSMRHLDGPKSTDEIPVHSFDRVEKLSPGEVVPVEIDLFPVGLVFHPGEQLRLVVTGHNILGGSMPNMGTVVPDNHGRHVVHTGGSCASYLRLPVKDEAGEQK